MHARSSIRVSEQIDGVHSWPDAPEHRFYLRSPHRHRFVVTVWIQVAHENRDVEFHDLQDRVRDMIRQGREGVINFSSLSCEHIARQLLYDLAAYGYTPLRVKVMEDDECGAEVWNDDLS